MKRVPLAPLGCSASWGRRERKAMLATPLEEAEGSPAPQGSLGPQGQREKLVSMAKLALQESRETRGTLERLENRDQLAPRAPRENQGKERWWIAMPVSTRRSRGPLVFPGKPAHLDLQASQARRGRLDCQALQDTMEKRDLEANQETWALLVPKAPQESLGL